MVFVKASVRARLVEFPPWPERSYPLPRYEGTMRALLLCVFRHVLASALTGVLPEAKQAPAGIVCIAGALPAGAPAPKKFLFTSEKRLLG